MDSLFTPLIIIIFFLNLQYLKWNHYWIYIPQCFELPFDTFPQAMSFFSPTTPFIELFHNYIPAGSGCFHLFIYFFPKGKGVGKAQIHFFQHLNSPKFRTSVAAKKKKAAWKPLSMPKFIFLASHTGILSGTLFRFEIILQETNEAATKPNCLWHPQARFGGWQSYLVNVSLCW